VARAALATRADAEQAARAFATDVIAYDQRGCMSPHALWVERGAAVSCAELGALVHEALAALARELPRGPLPLEAAAQQLSYRGISAMRGVLHEGRAHAVAVEDAGVLRLSPGHRNVQVLGVDDAEALMQRLAPLGSHLKCLGVAGLAPASLAAALPMRVAPRLCALGSMQRPPVDALADGVPAWEGLLRYAEWDAPAR
jgi:hypothetical protein